MLIDVDEHLPHVLREIAVLRAYIIVDDRPRPVMEIRILHEIRMAQVGQALQHSGLLRIQLALIAS